VTSPCTASAFIGGAAIALFGLFGFVLGVAAWVMPNSRFVQRLLVDVYPPRASAGRIERFFGKTREEAGFAAIVAARFFYPPAGALFFALGAWGTAAALEQCPAVVSLGASAFGPLQIRFSAVTLVFVAALGLVAAVGSFRLSTPRLVVNAVGAMCWAFAGTQSSLFHTGIQSDRWGALTIMLFFAVVAVNVVWQLRNKPR